MGVPPPGVAFKSASSSNSDDDRNKEFKKATDLHVIYFVRKTKVHHTSWYISLLTSHLEQNGNAIVALSLKIVSSIAIIESTHRESLVLILRLLLQVKVCSFHKFLNNLIKTLYNCLLKLGSLSMPRV